MHGVIENQSAATGNHQFMLDRYDGSAVGPRQRCTP